MKLDNIYPNNLNIKYDYIKVNNTFMINIIINELPKNINMFEMMNIIPKDIANTMSIHVQKLDRINELKQLSKIILETSSELKTISVTQHDRDVIKQINLDAMELRKKMQLENEDLYRVNIYIRMSDLDLNNLKTKVNKIMAALYSKGIFAKIGNFRHDLLYLNTLPLKNTNNYILKQTGINLTTEQMTYMIPYINNNMYDKNGVLLGYINKAFCIYDIFSKNNMNHNMCILGSSGAGKSYFVKTIVLRNFCNNIRQVIFDIEEEYLNISNKTDTYVFDEANFNLLYIPETFIKTNNNYMKDKINDIYIVLNNILKDRLSEFEDQFKKCLKNIYENFCITSDKESLYNNYNTVKITLEKEYRKYSEFPTIIELVDEIEKQKNEFAQVAKWIRGLEIYKKYDKDKAKELDKKYDTIIVFNIKNLSINMFDIYLSYIKQYYDQKLLIYIDEMWKFVNLLNDDSIDKKIAELFKTIRKRKAGIVVISQDVHDILKYKQGSFGKSILNNSFTKLFFKMQYMDLGVLEEIGICSKEAFNNIKRLVIGQAYITIGDVKFNIDIKTSRAEQEIIGGKID